MTRVVADRYELTRPVAGGGMGEVWAGYDQRLDRPVAVKLLRPGRFPQGTDLATLSQRFAREARLTARVEHPGVPAVFDAGTDAGDLYLVMQLIEGADLSDVITEQAPLPIGWAVAVAAQVATVLAVAHDASLVHRDLKPRNVMLSSDGTVTVLDFGVATVLEPAATRLTATGETLGSPAYMAPEQALEGKAGPTSDLYALGCVLYEMLVGAPVFTGETPLAVMHRHLSEQPVPLGTLRADVPTDLQQLVLDLLAKEPEQRPRDARVVYSRLVPHLVDDGSEPAPMDPTAPFRRPLAPPPCRHPAPSAAALAETDAMGRARELMEQDRYTQAAEVLEDALLSVTPHEAFYYRAQLATACFLGGDHRRALEEYGRVLADLDDDPAQDEFRYRVRSQAAFALAEVGDTSAALGELRAVLEWDLDHLGPEHRDVLELRQQMALMKASLGDPDGALADLDGVLQDSRRVLGPDDGLVRALDAQLHRLRARRTGGA